MTNIFVVDLENLKKCFEVIKQKNQQSQQMITEAQKYIEECKKDPQFPEILLTVFDDENEVPILPPSLTHVFGNRV